MEIKISKYLTKWFIKESKKRFPNEYYCYLAGSINGDTVKVELLIPPLDDTDEIIATEDTVRPSQEYWERAWTVARDRGFLVIGDIHSHCYTNVGGSDPAPSYMDFARFEGKRIKSFITFAICELRQIKERKYSKVTFWEAKSPPKIKYYD